MSQQQRPGTRRLGPLFGVLLVVVGTIAAMTPVVPAVRAIDPTPDPSVTVEPTAAADPTPAPPTDPPATEPPATPEPTAAPTEPQPEPTPVASADPTPEPSAASDPSPDPAAAADPSPDVTDPGPSPSVDPSPGLDPSPSADPSPSVVPSPSPSPTPAIGAQVGHAWINTEDRQGRVIAQGATDAALARAERFTVYVVRFQVLNDADAEVAIEPALQVSGGTEGWSAVPAVDPVAGKPFYAASDDGKVFKARKAVIKAGDLRLDLAAADPLAVAIDGVSSAGRNPMPALTLGAHTFTEIEFAVRGTVDAAWATGYRFRLATGDAALPGTATAELVMRSKPALDLSPGQRSGDAVDDPAPLYRLDPQLGTTDQPVTAGSETRATTVAYGLTGPLAASGSFTTPHLSSGLTSDTCAACHATHTAQGAPLLREPNPQSSICFTCHDGTGAVADVQRDWTSPAIPANDPATGSWYSHPATTTSNHSLEPDEFGGVLNRHSECADCHQPHLTDASRPIGTVGGWSSSGAIAAASGVSVTNGAAGTSPSYELVKTTTFEYELCFKCHSGYTELPAQDPAHPSRWALDKAVELNPANVSYHPVEAAGKNQTRAMARSLSGTSPYKLWNFDTTSTVRCVNCHGDPDLANPADPPAVDASLDSHGSPNRGILTANYRDRTLATTLELYDAGDFALCYLCHAEAPMVDGTGDARTDTNFNWHGLHLMDIWLNGTGGTSIDTPGAGQGIATCAECHFRTHGTALATGGQTPKKGLVNFAPDVQPLNGVLSVTTWTAGATGSCTLTCHGRPHNGFQYEGVP